MQERSGAKSSSPVTTLSVTRDFDLTRHAPSLRPQSDHYSDVTQQRLSVRHRVSRPAPPRTGAQSRVTSHFSFFQRQRSSSLFAFPPSHPSNLLLFEFLFAIHCIICIRSNTVVVVGDSCFTAGA